MTDILNELGCKELSLLHTFQESYDSTPWAQCLICQSAFQSTETMDLRGTKIEKHLSFKYKRSSSKLFSSSARNEPSPQPSLQRESTSHESPTSCTLTSSSKAFFKMKPTFVALLAVTLIRAAPGPPGLICRPGIPLSPLPPQCAPEKPTCPAGRAPTGGPGCWGCCAPDLTVVTRADQPDNKSCNLCLPEEPPCPLGEIPTGHEGCWGCCVHPPPGICDLCSPERPGCPIGEAPSGGPGCWGCCAAVN